MMSKINLYLPEIKNGVRHSEDNIRRAIKNAEDFAFSKLDINWDIDVFIKFEKNKNPEVRDRVSGHTYQSDFIALKVEDGFSDFEISEVLVHELCHAARWGKNPEYIKTLYDALIFEGLAVYFASEFIKDKESRQDFMNIILSRSDEKNEKILSGLKDQLESTNYDYDEIFGWNKKMPWAGYSLGHYLLKHYLTKANKKIKEIYVERYNTFQASLRLPLNML